MSSSRRMGSSASSARGGRSEPVARRWRWRPRPPWHVPDKSPIALLLIDTINDFDYEEADGVLAEARAMADAIRRLKSRVRRAGVPVVYVNDNFGRWRSDFRRLVAHCSRARGPGSSVARALRPDRQDYFVLKPMHSGFYATSLGLLLDHLGARTPHSDRAPRRHVRPLHRPRRLHAKLPRRRAGRLCGRAQARRSCARARAHAARDGGGHAAVVAHRSCGTCEETGPAVRIAMRRARPTGVASS